MSAQSKSTPRGPWMLAVLVLVSLAYAIPADARPPSRVAVTGAGGAHQAGLRVGIKARLSGRSDEDLLQVVSSLRKAGVTQVRENVSWGRIEPSPGVLKWAEMDRWVAAAARQDLEVIALVGGPPGWATPAWNVAPVSGAPLTAFSTFVRRLVERYGSAGSFWRAHPEVPAVPITYYDIWNEPWVSQFWSRDFPDPAGYAHMFKAVVQTARPADPHARFLLEADTRVIETGWPWRPFLSAMFDAVPDLGAYAYAVSVHPYQGDGGSPRTCSRFTPSRGVEQDWRATVSQFCRIHDIRSILDARGAGETKIWITEIGWSTASGLPRSVSEAKQATYVNEVFDLLRAAQGLVAGVVWYEYQGPESDPSRLDHFFGLVRADGTPKPAWKTFADEVRPEADEVRPEADEVRPEAPAPPVVVETLLTRRPRAAVKPSARAKVKFAFVANVANARFECRLGRTSFSQCSSPMSYRRRLGKHRFQVRAVDTAGNRDPSPATHRFRVRASRGGRQRVRPAY